MPGRGGVLRVTPERAAELVRAAADGDANAWQELVDGFSALVWSTVLKFRLNQSDAIDVTQTTWLRLVQNIDRLDDPARVGAWLTTTARREALRVIEQHRRVILTADSAVLDGSDHRAAPPESGLIGEERDLVVRELFDQLPPRCQELLRLVLRDPPVDYDTISTRLGMPVGSIGPTRGRCLKKLAALAAERGIDLGDMRGL
ncbi:MAG TPA: sigma-70 family RNA polymerase sigma factor [Mycobacteriales bacterium]|nr:sigma-70 family RNA polymerase sigma factor [Mycobacteriales bacterium]